MNHYISERLIVNMSSVVIEFEGFQVKTNDFVIKELAFYVVDHGYHARWSFLPPYPWEQLTVKNRKSYAWLTRYCHGLRWDSGELPYSALERIVSSLFISYKTIYTKGLEKTKFLEKISKRKIFNLNDFGCPKIDSLKRTVLNCPSHKSHFKHCALLKAFSYGEYIKERLNLDFVIYVQDVNPGTSQTVKQDETEISLS